MLGKDFSALSSQSLMQEYATVLGDAVLRNRARSAEHRARIETEVASRVKTEFLSNMSHELRTPLNTVLGFSKILREHGDRPLAPNQIVEYATLIHDAASNLLAVINDILDISKLHSGTYTLSDEPVDLGDLVQASVESHRAAAAQAGVTLRERFPPLAAIVRGDGVKLGKAIANLLSNAIKFSHAGGAVLIEVAALGDGRASLLIADTGAGMSDEEIEIALQPFAQVDGSRSRSREGTGLGLPIAKALIELHGGEFSIVSEKGRGTEISIVFPSTTEIGVMKAREAILGHSARR